MLLFLKTEKKKKRYAGRNQTKETEFFSNNATSPMFEEFLSFLGDKIELDGWDGFRGGSRIFFFFFFCHG